MALCTHCGSKYTEFKRTEDSFEKKSEIYFCQSCKREFAISTAKNAAAGTWLMTLYGNKKYSFSEEYDQLAEIYRKSDGTLVINEKKESVYKTRTILPKIYPRLNQYTQKYNIWYDTFRSMNDAEGTYIVVESIKLSPELMEKAKNNEAMRAIKGGADDLFVPGSHPNTVLLNDVCSWICSQLGVTQTAPKGSGCYVATCVYGSYDCPEVWTLRRYRDNTLSETWYGRLFIKTYYAISPTLVKWFGDTIWFKKLFKDHLDKIVLRLQDKGFKNTPYIDKEK